MNLLAGRGRCRARAGLLVAVPQLQRSPSQQRYLASTLSLGPPKWADATEVGRGNYYFPPVKLCINPASANTVEQPQFNVGCGISKVSALPPLIGEVYLH